MEKGIEVIIVGDVGHGSTTAILEMLHLQKTDDMSIIVIDANKAQEQIPTPFEREPIKLTTIPRMDDCFIFDSAMRNEAKRQKQQEKFRRRHSK